MDVRVLKKLGVIQRSLGPTKRCVIAGWFHCLPQYAFQGPIFLALLRVFVLNGFVFAGVDKTGLFKGTPIFVNLPSYGLTSWTNNTSLMGQYRLSYPVFSVRVRTACDKPFLLKNLK